MPLKTRKRTLLAKIEVTYGVDPTPTGGANAILISNMSVTPIAQNYVPRDLVRNYLGASENLIAASWKAIEFETEMAGSGTAGDAPAWGPLMQGCAMAETISAGVSVVYNPISSSEKSLTMYANIDGMLHKILGARGTFSLDFTAGARPVIKWSFIGLFVAITDAALPSLTLTAWKKPLVVNNTNTTGFALHSFAAVLQSLQVNMNNTNTYRNLVGVEDVQFTDRAPGGPIVIEQPLVAAKDYFGNIQAVTTGALTITHGTVAGNKFKFDAPAVQLTNPRNTDLNGNVMLAMDALFIPGSSGNDELTITAL